MQVNFSQKRIGVLGGGQLARMLTLQGHKLGLQVHVLSEKENNTADQVTHFWHKGHLNVHNDLKIFLKHVDVATFESEFIDGLLLHEIGHEISTPVHPRPMVMNSLRDRLKQKNLLKEHLLPHTKFVEFDVSCSWSSYKKIFPKGTVIKQNLFGYDGYGTFFVHTPNEHKKFIEKNNRGDLL